MKSENQIDLLCFEKIFLKTPKDVLSLQLEKKNKNDVCYRNGSKIITSKNN